MEIYNSFKPGEQWFDTNGKLIQAHGGSVLYEDGIYYWYGENKDKITGDNGMDFWGVRCYTSKDLYNWEDKGLIIEPNLSDETSPLHPKSIGERPHIIFNEETKKYVCWLKTWIKGKGTYTVLTADNILGPYTIKSKDIKPLGMVGGSDFDLKVADDGKAYIYYPRIWSEMICADLTSDYTDVNGFYSTHFHRPHPPFSREAPAHFIRKHKHYIITSGTTGYFPNPSEVAVGDTWHGPFKVLGNPHTNDETNTSFYSQVSSVFKVQGKKDLYIACADRWVPDYMDIPYEFYNKYMDIKYSLESDENSIDEYLVSLAEERAKITGNSLETELKYYKELESRFYKSSDKFNTSISRYVWLPIRFVEHPSNPGEDMAYIDWKDEWRIQDYN